MVRVVKVGAAPERQDVVQAPGEIVAGVGVDGLEQAQRDPGVHGQDVQVAGNRAVQDGRKHRAEAEEHDLDRRRVLGRHAEGRRVLVVDLVHVLVEGPPVEHAVRPVMPRVLGHEEERDLVGHGEERWKGYARPQPEKLGHRVEEPDLRQLDGEVREEDQLGAGPLLGRGGHFLLIGLRQILDRAGRLRRRRE